MYIMKHLMRYEGYSTQQRVDDLLDKINKSGINSLSPMEKEFLDAHKSGTEDKVHDKLTKEESEKVFVDDDGRFKFTLDSVEDYGDETHYIGTLECPDYTYAQGETIPGILPGKIVVFSNGQTSPDFHYENTGLDVWDFCEGLEYELDNFLDYVVGELDNENQ